jgi:hypothetical protein
MSRVQTQFPKTMSEEQQPLEIGVRKMDSHSFTIEGTNDQLEKNFLKNTR